MKKIYLAIISLALSAGMMAQTVSIGTSTTAPSGNTFRSPWAPIWGYTYSQTIYLQSEINTSGTITSLKFNYAGTSLVNSDQITVWMGKITRGVFASTTDWEPLSNLTQVFNGVATYSSLPGIVTVNLTTPFAYNNTGNLVIAVHESEAGLDDTYFFASEVGTARTLYKVDDEVDPDPTNPPAGDNIRTKVGNIQIVFGAAQPITLSSFSGEKLNASNRLSWTTHTEQNNKGFELQRSADGVSFTSVGFIESKSQSGNSTAVLTYTYNDDTRLRGNNYYRLKQVDFDGKATFSKVVMLKGSSTKLEVTAIYPNPAKNDLNIILSSPKSDKATVYITNVAGKVVYTTATTLASGDNKIHVNPSAFAAGIYTVKAVYAGSKESVVSKFVKQ